MKKKNILGIEIVKMIVNQKSLKSVKLNHLYGGDDCFVKSLTFKDQRDFFRVRLVQDLKEISLKTLV